MRRDIVMLHPGNPYCIPAGRYVRVNKAAARRAYDSNMVVWLQTSNYCFVGGWQFPFQLWRENYPTDPAFPGEYSFDSLVRQYEYYNCQYETGYYVSFYVRVEE